MGVDLLQDAYDIHVHAAPDVMPRAVDIVELYREASEAGMAGVLLKDHCFPTHAAAYALNHGTIGSGAGCRAFGAIALNVTLGGLNPLAVEGALKSGCDLVYFPTYSSGPHLEKLGSKHLPMPLPRGPFAGIGITADRGTIGFGATPGSGARELERSVHEIIETIKKYDAVLATGHLSPEETLALVRAAHDAGLTRVIVTHASEVVPGLSVAQQAQAVEMGAWIEHCFLATTDAVPGSIPVAEIVRQTKEIGAEHVILSSDYGKESLGSPVQGFARALTEALAEGLTADELDLVVRRNPHMLLVSDRELTLG